MIPKIIHYCWFGRGDMPDLVQEYIALWHHFMPDWDYRLWNEDNFDITLIPYCKEAYEAKKYAFVSDYVRLWALEREGGVYFDTDVEVFKPFDDLLGYSAFAGFEGSKQMPVGTGIMASEAHGLWVNEMLEAYKERHFMNADGSYDLTTNVEFISTLMRKHGFAQNGKEQDYKDLHVFPTEYFCPRQTTGEFLLTENTYCDHHFMGTWTEHVKGWKTLLLNLFGQKGRIWIIKAKRKLENL